MRFIGESKAIDLSKKLKVEITVGELAYITAMVGAQSVDSAKKAVDADFAVANRYKEDVKQYDNDDVYDELYEILKAEGVAE